MAFDPSEPRGPYGRWSREGIASKIGALPVGKRVGINGHTVDNIPSKGLRVRIKGETRHYSNPEDAAASVHAGRHVATPEHEAAARDMLKQAQRQRDIAKIESQKKDSAVRIEQRKQAAARQAAPTGGKFGVKMTPEQMAERQKAAQERMASGKGTPGSYRPAGKQATESAIRAQRGPQAAPVGGKSPAGGINASHLGHSEAIIRDQTVFPSSTARRHGARPTTHKVLHTSITDAKGDRVASVQTKASGYGEVTHGNFTTDVYPKEQGLTGRQAHERNVASAKDIVAARVNAAKTRAALNAGGHTVSRSHSTAVRGYRNFTSGYQVEAGEQGVRVTHYSGFIGRSDAPERMTALNDKMEAYAKALRAKGIVPTEHRDDAGNLILVTVDNAKQGGGSPKA